MSRTDNDSAQGAPWAGSGPAAAPSRHTRTTGGRTHDGEVQARARVTPEPSPQARLAAVQAAKNPLLEAAQELLRALADVPEVLNKEELEMFHTLLRRGVVTFQAVCTDAQIKHQDIVAASYALCTALDESASSTTWGGGQGGEVGLWAGKHRRWHGACLLGSCAR